MYKDIYIYTYTYVDKLPDTYIHIRLLLTKTPNPFSTRPEVGPKAGKDHITKISELTKFISDLAACRKGSSLAVTFSYVSGPSFLLDAL